MDILLTVPSWTIPLLATIFIWLIAAAKGWLTDQGMFDFQLMFGGLCCIILSLIAWLIWAVLT